MSMRKKYETKVEEQMTAWSAQLETLKSQTGDLMKTGFEAALAEWKGALVKLEALKASAGGRWGSVKVEVEHACRGVEVALGRILHSATAAPKEAASAEVAKPDLATRITERNMAVVGVDSEPTSAGTATQPST